MARQYTGIKSVPETRVQALNEEVHFVEGTKLAEENVQKVVNNPLGKEVIKRKTDTYEEKPYERNKKVIKSARASVTEMNTSVAPKKWQRSTDFYRPTFATRRARGFRGGLDQRSTLLNRDQQVCLPTTLLGLTG